MIRASVTALTLIAAAMAVSTPASAKEGGQVSIGIRAEVPLFCRIQAPFDGAATTVAENGEIVLGAVTEVCNSIHGYTVQAEFMNLASGNLVVDNEVNPVVNGAARYSHPRASLRTRFWKLSNIDAEAMQGPVYVRVSISPL